MKQDNAPVKAQSYCHIGNRAIWSGAVSRCQVSRFQCPRLH